MITCRTVAGDRTAWRRVSAWSRTRTADPPRPNGSRARASGGADWSAPGPDDSPSRVGLGPREVSGHHRIRRGSWVPSGGCDGGSARTALQHARNVTLRMQNEESETKRNSIDIMEDECVSNNYNYCVEEQLFLEMGIDKTNDPTKHYVK